MFMVGGGNYIEYQNLVDYVKVRGYTMIIQPMRVHGDCL